jgi:MerR family copper efflux transcriptional regulator
MPRRPPSSASPSDVPPLRTAALCRVAGVTRGQLRVYEREGLLEPPPRSASGYRGWPAATPARLLAIRQLKEVGFTLREIAVLLAERDLGTMTTARLKRMAREQLTAIDARIARLQVVREYVAAVADGDRSVLDDPECRFLVHFLAADAITAVPPAASARTPAARRGPARRRTTQAERA